MIQTEFHCDIMAGLRRSTRLSSKGETNKAKPEEESALPPQKKLKKSTGTKTASEESLGSQDEEESSAEPSGDSSVSESSKGEDSEFKEEEESEGQGESQSKELEVGDRIPDISLKNQNGEEVSLRKVAEEHRIVVIFGYPKASTPGCTRQACGFRDNYEDLKKHAAVFGISADTVNAQKKFQEKFDLPYDLLSEPQRHLVGLLGAKKTADAGVIRSHWVFADGILKYKRVKISPEVSIEEGKKEVLDLVKDFEKTE